MPTIRELADRTPATRRRHVDLLRAVAMLAVVLGHWLVMTVERDAAGHLTGFTALQELTWVHPLTWVFQVMPVFFLVGGVSNAISWTRHRERGGTVAAWLLGRSERLFPPVTVLLLAVAGGALVAGWAGVAPHDVAQAVHLVTMPLWFLVVYLGVVALTPAAHRLHERFGLLVPLVLVAAVALGDAARLATGDYRWAFGSFAFAWLAVHQVGFAWQDGRLRLTRRRAAALVVVAGVALVLLTVPGPYPVSMVSVPGAALQNASPPSLALLALAAVQVGVAGLVAPAAERALRRPGPWTAVVGANSMILTLYLWHMVAALGGGLALDALGLLPSSDVHSGAWWAGRVPWILTLLVLQVLLVAVFGRVESGALARRLRRAEEPRRTASRRARAGALTAVPVVATAYAAAIAGVFVLARAGQGPHGPFAVPTASLVLVLGGAAVLRVARSAAAAPR